MACCGKARKLRLIQQKKRLKEAAEMKFLVQDPSWQATRKRLVGAWTDKPEWACGELKKFVGQISKATPEKLRIVMNYLTGTGFRTGKIKHKCILHLRTQISMEMRKRKVKKEW
jgi:hypothetical protein